MVLKWDKNSNHKKNMRIFSQVSNNLCGSRNFRDLRKGYYKRAKGCYKVYSEDKSGKRRKRFNDYGATMHPEHVRCDNMKATSVCESGVSGITVVDNYLREMHSFPFVVFARKVCRKYVQCNLTVTGKYLQGGCCSKWDVGSSVRSLWAAILV